jgi:methyl-accepting chemotaxis protein
MNIQADDPIPSIEEVVASTQQQLDKGRRIVAAAKRLAAATEAQASTASQLAQETEQLVDNVQATIPRADAVAGSGPEKNASE